LDSQPMRRRGSGEARSQKAPGTGKLTARSGWLAGIWYCSGEFAPISSPPPLRQHTGNPEALSMRFLRHRGIYQSDGGWFSNPSLSWSRHLPPAAPDPDSRTRREDHVLLIVPMSSDRLFLDRVGRHQSPSPLRRHAQINMHSSTPRAEGDISTLPEWRHFYFALTLFIFVCR
jgi:hypothetical protein